MKVAAIVPSAGCGNRMRSKRQKPFIRLCGEEILLYPLKILEKSRHISEVIIPVSRQNIGKVKKLIKRKGFKKVKDVICGGSTRANSVKRAFYKVSADTDFILIHDSVRPFLTEEMISACLKTAKKFGASLCAVRVKPTIKKSNIKGFIKKTLKRDLLWEAQTPQVFRRSLLGAAYKRLGKNCKSFTDDTAAFEAIGGKVKIVEGDYSNIKITTQEDLIIAEAILKGKGRDKGKDCA